jgi:hypothetical protein
MTSFTSKQEAMAIISDTTRSDLVRKEAIHHLQYNASPESNRLLVQMLMDDEAGVRWAAADALANIGEDALPVLLRALVQNAGNGQLRAGAHHILSANRSYCVHKDCEALLKALEGPASDIAVMDAASTLLHAKGLAALSEERM